MSKIVVKFGGSNLRTQQDIEHVLSVIRKYNRPLVVVVSAFYGITNMLEEMLFKAQHDHSAIGENLDVLIAKKRDMIFTLIKNKDIQNSARELLDIRIKALKRYLQGVNYIGEIPPFVSDIVMSFGERLSAAIMTALLQDRGVDCEEVTPEDMQLITDGEFGNAEVDFSASSETVRNRLSGEKTAIVPGFYGVSKEGKVTLFGRGGSDYTAASIASCINAESLDIWKDVDGFRTADPKLVAETHGIHQLTYTEAAELAYFGAKILHPRTVEPLMAQRIPVMIFNIAKTELTDRPYTIISDNGTRKDDIIKSVTYSDDFCILKLEGPGVGNKPGILAKVTREMDHKGINIKSVITSQTSINILLGLKDLQPAFQAVAGLKLTAVKTIITEDDLSVIAAVGEGLLEKHGIAVRMFGAVSRRGINMEIISVGASQVAAYFIVRRNDRDEAVKAIHAEFFNNPKDK
ncbi:aspartate kinase [bacterium]|nr:aspartate kinase [bacterium]MBU1065662.1 aspartate kinase [bacterium]MBU1635817.1 aspartate kinase [bacterium]MBU1875377.1 aspartate kinase [bacterium]